MKKLSVIAAALVAVSSLAFAAPVFADSPGQLASGPDLYQVRNVTKNSGYASSTSASCDETVKFSIKLSNSEFGLLTNVNVKAPLGGTMTASATNAANKSTSVSGSVSVNTGQGKLVYVPGSTVNLDVNGGHIKNLADGITTTGANKGNLNGSTREFVQFQAKVTCDTPQVPAYRCDLLDIKAETGRKVTVTKFDTTATNGATYKNAILSWGDGSDNLSVVNPVGQTHVYAKDGTYTIKATAVFTVDGKDVTHTSAACAKQVSFSEDKPPVVTPPEVKGEQTPTTLVNTGAGDVAALFAIVTVAGALAHRLVWARLRG